MKSTLSNLDVLFPWAESKRVVLGAEFITTDALWQFCLHSPRIRQEELNVIPSISSLLPSRINEILSRKFHDNGNRVSLSRTPADNPSTASVNSTLCIFTSSRAASAAPLEIKWDDIITDGYAGEEWLFQWKEDVKLPQGSCSSRQMFYDLNRVPLRRD